MNIARNVLLALLVMPAWFGLKAQPKPPPQHYLSVYDQASGRHQDVAGNQGIFELSGDTNRINAVVLLSSDTPSTPDTLSRSWYITVQAPQGETIRPGLYTDVGCPQYPVGRVYRLQVTTNNPLCRDRDTIFGWLTVRQVEFAPDGRPIRLELLFSQRVGSEKAPELKGVLRYNAFENYFRLKSSLRAPWGAFDEESHLDTGYIGAGGDPHMFVSASASVIKKRWDVSFRSSINGGLPVGVKIPIAFDRSNDRAFFRISRDGERLTCPNPQDQQGWVRIKKMDLSFSNSITGIWADFEMHCGRAGLVLRGEYRVNI